MNEKQKKKYTMYGILALIILSLFFYYQNVPVEVAQKEDLASGMYLTETSEFDYSDKAIQEVAKKIWDMSETKLDIIKNTIRYTADHVTYQGDITVSYCIAESASDVLRSGKGDCVSMSKLNTALLRANNISTRTLGGCVSFSKSCTMLFAMFPEEDIPRPTFVGDNKKRGYLHEWVEAYDGLKWVSIESTTGNIFESGCGRYEIFGYDNTPYSRCVIDDYSFISECATK
jgi:transglutaminase-like putative cysteine protease